MIIGGGARDEGCEDGGGGEGNMVTRRILSVTPVYNLVAKVGILGVPSLSASEEQIGPDAEIRKQKIPWLINFCPHLPSLNTWWTRLDL